MLEAADTHDNTSDNDATVFIMVLTIFGQLVLVE